MGLVKTRWRLAEDMHRRGEASEGTLPKATRRARKRVRSPHRAGAEVLPMWECCQFQCCQFPIGDWNWLMRKYGAGRIGLVYYSAKEKIDGT